MIVFFLLIFWWCFLFYFFFFNDTATTEIYTLSLHDALPIYLDAAFSQISADLSQQYILSYYPTDDRADGRSEEHTSELQSRENLVCRLLLEKKKTKNSPTTNSTYNDTISTHKSEHHTQSTII